MVRSRRTLYYLLVLFGATVLLTVAYAWGMSAWEGRPRPWYQALEVVVQTFTTTGYGEDAPWQSPQMNLLMIVVQVVGIGLILSAVDVFVVPWLREALQPTAPGSLPEQTGHVLVCGHSQRVDVFIEELETRGHEYALVEPDAERAGALYEEEYPVMEGDPTSSAALERAHAASASALVADVADDENASIVLAAREVAPETRLITLAEDASLARYHRAAGADVALSPRQLLGRSLASKIPVAAAANVETGVADTDDIDFAELIVTPKGPFHGRALADVHLEDRFGVRAIGAWMNDRFELPVDDTQVLDENTRLLLAGPPARLEDLHDELAPYVRTFASQSILLAGYGDSGQTVADSLRPTAADLTVLDRADKEGVDVVGDVRDPEALRDAGLESASAFIVAVDDDTVATFATLIARDLNAEVQILVRAHEETAVQNLHRAGADFVEALPTVCGRMLAATVLEDEQRRAPDRAVNVVRWPVGKLEGRPLSTIVPDAQTNYTVLAVQQGETFLTDPREDERIGPEDELIVAGTEDGLQEFRSRVETAAEDA